MVIDRVAMRSEMEGYETSRLPALSDDEIAYIKGTHDYLALNHYATNMVNATGEVEFGDPSFGKDINVVTWRQPDWPSGSWSWFAV